MTTFRDGLGDAWRADVYRATGSWSHRELVRLLARSRVFRPVFTARLCQYQGSGIVAALVGRVARQLHRWAQQQAGLDFPWEVRPGPGLTFVHGWGVVISPAARIGANVTIFHGATVGRKDDIAADGARTVGGAPTIEDAVWIGPGALIVGPILIGEGARVGGGAVVTKDVAPGSMVVGNPASVVSDRVPPDCPNRVDLAELRAQRSRGAARQPRNGPDT